MESMTEIPVGQKGIGEMVSYTQDVNLAPKAVGDMPAQKVLLISISTMGRCE